MGWKLEIESGSFNFYGWCGGVDGNWKEAQRNVTTSLSTYQNFLSQFNSTFEIMG